MTTVDARWALTTDGWQPDVRIAIVDGRVDSIAPAAAAGAAGAAADLVVPGMPNAHCHAVQYAIAGAAESVRAGQKLATPLAACGLLPLDVVSAPFAGWTAGAMLLFTPLVALGAEGGHGLQRGWFHGPGIGPI